jgi:hypothetical protein
LASITQLPTPVKSTVPLVSAHAPASELESMLSTTGLPEPPPVAVGVYEPP